MRVIGKQQLDKFCEKHVDVRSQISSWLAEVENAEWQNPNELKTRYPSASLVEKRVVFNLKGNKYRLLVRIDYKRQLIRIEKIGTHEEYDRWEF